MKLSTFLNNRLGVSLPMVVAIIAAGTASLGYLTVQILPKLQSEKKKSEQTISYRIFMSSLNDYVVNAIKEKWCISTYGTNETDLLLSNECSSSKPMETVVTYKGNLERILWNADVIGTQLTSMPNAEEANTILALNYIRLHSSPQKTTKRLTFADIAPVNNKLEFVLTDKILEDMTKEHPLFTMTQNVKKCISKVNIEIFKTKEFNNTPAGDERKIGIKISVDTKTTSLSCLTLRKIQSLTFYTFYPRRLHYYALIKYGDLETNHLSEFHGPVYVAGNVKLPPEDLPKTKSSVFIAPVTLGIYNSGGGTGSNYYAGSIQTSDNQNYSFEDFGHPIRSKQSYYPNFKGFLGGVALDATEDRGFHNLFNYSSQSSVNSGQLEACIEDSKSQTTPSYNNESVFAYGNFNTNSNKFSLRFSFTRKNRFQLNKDAPRVLKKEKDIKNLDIDVSGVQNGTKEFGKVEFKTSDGTHSASFGHNSSVDLTFDLKNLDFHPDNFQDYINNTRDAKKNNLNQVLPMGHVLRNSNQFKDFIDAGENFKDKCDKKASLACATLLGYNTDTECLLVINCLYPEAATYLSKKDNLISFLQDLKQKVSSAPLMSLKFQDVKQNSKVVLNQKDFQFSINESFLTAYRYNKNQLSSPYRFDIIPFHYGNQKFKLSVDLKDEDLSEYRLIDADSGQRKNFIANDWRNTLDNSVVSPAPNQLFEMNCPAGMGVADWDLDMSASTNFAWNYANTPPGVEVDNSDHEMLPEVVFDNTLNEGHQKSFTKSIIKKCIIPADREEIYGFYVCEKLIIQGPRKKPLYFVGTFIIKDLVIPSDLELPVYWHSLWDTKASDLILNNFNKDRSTCSGNGDLIRSTIKDYIQNPQLLSRLKSCGSLDLVTNGPNNFSWTTIDPDIGLASSTDVMTSQKVKRIQKWVTREETRIEVIR